MFADLVAEARSFSTLELAAVLLAVGYLLLAIRQNIWCWFCAVLSTACYIWLFYAARLYMESLLNVFYFTVAVYGWYAWSHGGGLRDELPVCRWPGRRHGIAVVAVLLLSGVTGGLLERYTAAAYPYVDSMTTYAAIWTTFLVARKVLENWGYWLLIDSASIVIYWSRGLPLTALLFAVYVILIPFGYLSWRRSWRDRAAA